MGLLLDQDIVNAACARIGEDPPDMNDDVDGAGPVALLYQEVIDFNLGLYPAGFSFSKQLFQLSIDDAIVDHASGYAYGFDLPAEALELPMYVTDNPKDRERRFNDYALLDGKLHADKNPLWAMCRYRPAPARWSATFRTCTITSLASRLALALTSDRNNSEALRIEAYGSPGDEFLGGQMRAAIRADSFATPPRQPNWDNNPLTNSRWGG